MTYVLHYAPDNASLCVRIALLELDFPFRTALVDRAARAQHSASYRAINPVGLIPALETPDGALFETGAILLWLADQKPGLAPTPQSPRRGRFLKWLFFISNTLHANLRVNFYPDKLVGADSAAQANLYSNLRARLQTDLAMLDAACHPRGPFFMGGVPTAVDVYLGPLLRWCALYPEGRTDWFDLSQYPRLARLAQAMETRPSVITAAAAEGLGHTPFTAPTTARPPEGSAT